MLKFGDISSAFKIISGFGKTNVESECGLKFGRLEPKINNANIDKK